MLYPHHFETIGSILNRNVIFKEIFLGLKLEISITTEMIEFFFSRKLYRGPELVLGYLSDSFLLTTLIE